nr:MAG: hypothetical protein [Bacteriophage sp.]
MKVNDIKTLMFLMKNIEFARTEFLIDIKDYISNNEFADTNLEEWLSETNQLAHDLTFITGKLLNDFEKDNGEDD